MVERRISLNGSIGINVKYSVGKKPAVLFLHFSGGTLHMWDGVLPLFTDHYRVVAPDLRGHGQSDKPDIGYHIDEMAQDMYVLLRELDIDRCHIVGSSMGAEVGLSLAAAHPAMVASLVCEGALYNEFGEYGLYNGSNEEINRVKNNMRVQLSERRVPVFSTPIEYFNASRRSFERQKLWNEHFSAFVESTMMRTPDGNYTSHYLNLVRTQYIESYWEVAFETYYRMVRCPILFLPSEEEWNNRKIRSSLSAFAGFVEAYEILQLPGAVHAYVWMQMPEIAGHAAKAFIGVQDLADGE